MCGIIAITHKNSDVKSEILDSLKRLEYRGYDSAGISVIGSDNKIKCVKTVGKIENLITESHKHDLSGRVGLGHTRWATHGKVCVENSHPFTCGDVSVVHNGIIENYSELKAYLQSQGENFQSETDTEVIPVLINFLIKNGHSFHDAFKQTVKKLTGAYAISAISTKEPGLIAVAKFHSPLVVGFGKDLSVVGSDAFSIISLANNMTYLSDGDYGFLDNEGTLTLWNKEGESVVREIVSSGLNISSVGKDGYKHYMLKEVHEQPVVLRSVLNSYTSEEVGVTFPSLDSLDLVKYKRIKIIACGTSYYSGAVAADFFERHSAMNCDCYIASEYRYKNIILDDDTLYVAISQSGETADTIGAIKEIKSRGGVVVSIVNADESTMELISDAVIKCHAGQEIGVASTKAFTSQIVVLLMLSLYIGCKKNRLTAGKIASIVANMDSAVMQISKLLADEKWLENISDLAKKLTQYHSLIYLGRGSGWAIAQEGSLKMKELTYIHSEALASGELKHGSIALIDKSIPVVAICPSSNHFSKNASNIESVFSRDGQVVLISDEEGIKYFSKFADATLGCIKIPGSTPDNVSILSAVPLQLLAYYTALAKGHDVDQPRNLAKSVTVE